MFWLIVFLLIFFNGLMNIATELDEKLWARKLEKTRREEELYNSENGV